MSTSKLNTKAKFYQGAIPTDKTIPNNTGTTLGTLSLPAGTYIATGGYTCTAAFAAKRIQVRILLDGDVVGGTTMRATGERGGGVNTCAFVTLSSAGTLTLQAYQSSGSSKTASNVDFTAVKIM